MRGQIKFFPELLSSLRFCRRLWARGAVTGAGQSVTMNYFDVAEAPMLVRKTVWSLGKPFTVIGLTKPEFHGIMQLINSNSGCR
jgi:hypothetical protein